MAEGFRAQLLSWAWHALLAVLAPPLVRTVAALMAGSPAGDEAKRATRAAAEPEVESPPEQG